MIENVRYLNIMPHFTFLLSLIDADGMKGWLLGLVELTGNFLKHL